jgi:chemotaxis protein CheD
LLKHLRRIGRAKNAMMTATLTKSLERNIGMAEVAIIRQPEIARMVLGSCVGLVLIHEARGIAAIAHVVLPDAGSRAGPPCKFADVAVPHMVRLLENEKASVRGLVAKVAGGASMFQTSGPIQIGVANQTAIRQALRQAGIPIVAEHLGGTKGRRITFGSDGNELLVEIAGEASVRI